MARVLTKKSTVAAKVPLATDLEIGELAVNTADAKLYTKHSDNTVKQLGIATNDSRLTDAREWTASTVSQAEAEAGTATTRRAWTAQRVFQAVAAWWAASADKTKLDGIQAGAQVNVPTNLAQGTRTTTAVPVTSSTGTGATLGAATTSLAGVMTAADKTKLDGVATGATANASDAQLRDRATHTGSQAISTVTGLQTALDNKINTSERGVSGGIATLDQFARIPASQLPSYVDDVLEYATTAQFPATGESGKIYIAVNQGTAANPTRQYRWTGSVYAEINPSPGTTDVLAEGSTNLYFSEHRVRNTVLTGLSLAVSTAVTAADSVLSALGKLQARLNLLGTAANANVQTSATATTTGALMAVGAFGLGAASFPSSTYVTDADALTATGDYMVGATWIGSPSPGTNGANQGSLRHTANFQTTGYAKQEWVSLTLSNPRKMTRSKVNGAWASWVEEWHTGNFDPATKQDKSALVTSATSRTLALTDAWNYVRPGTTSAITLTVPTNASVAFEIGTEITVRALGNVTLAAASGVTLNAPSGGTLSMTARMTVTLKKVATNEWDVIGQTVPA